MEKLSIIIPAYNEEKNIKDGCLEQVKEYLQKQIYPWEVLLVDDGSEDLTLKLLRKFAESNSGFRVITEPHRGKGGTVIAGMLKTKGDIILFTDLDQATPINEIEK
ncbi:glycosyltransferase, partial [Patescibacteria group bacterium]|nr:glycosyltransferase [Patescibacteria group bacterium]